MSTSAEAIALLDSPARRELYNLLAALPPVPSAEAAASRERGLTASELADRLGVHVTTARFHLDQLLEAGLLTSHDERGQVGRPKRRYAVAPGPAEVRTSEAYRVLEGMLDDALDHDSAVMAEDMGRAWFEANRATILGDANLGDQPAPAANRGEWFSKLGHVLDVLDRWGYAPEVQTSHAGHCADLQLHSCPFREVAETNPGVACATHKGVVIATLEALGEGAAKVRLQPFAEPDLCIAHICNRTDLTHPTDLPHPKGMDS